MTVRSVQASGQFTEEGQIYDPLKNISFPGRLHVRDGRIEGVENDSAVRSDKVITPGLVDAHVHIESTMLPPAEAGRLMAARGAVATVSDPHEIANVNGEDGVQYMIDEARKGCISINFGAPSCVPAAGGAVETAGTELDAAAVGRLLRNPEIKYLAEVMNFPGVLRGEEKFARMIACAQRLGKPVDGHAPGLAGEDAIRYIRAGISTDHECFTYEEALHKLKNGMKILIREGSAAKNYEALAQLIDLYADSVMLCTDDSHPDRLLTAHIDESVRRSLAKGIDPLKVLRAASVNPVHHYGLDVGLLQPGDWADFLVLDDLAQFAVARSYFHGEKIAEHGKPLTPHSAPGLINKFEAQPVPQDALTTPKLSNRVNAIRIIPGQLITAAEVASLSGKIGENAVSDTEHDLLKIVVINRYQRHSTPAVGFVRGLQLREGALASTVAHDSHNIVAVGVTDADIISAVNGVIESKGGLSFARGGQREVLPLPIAGLMSPDDGYSVARRYTMLDSLARASGSSLASPYMALSFLALPVIPELKMTDKGLFSLSRFEHVPLFV